LKLRVVLIVLGVVVLAVYGVLAVLVIGLPGRSGASQKGFTALAAYPAALAAAQAWQSDAQLVSATTSWSDLTADELFEAETSWGFTFHSPQTREIRIVSAAADGAEGIESLPATARTRGVDVGFWQVDSPQVLDLFLNHGGRDFLAQHPGATVSLRLGPEEGGERLVWLAFGIYTADRSTMTLQVDANTGEVISRAP
jgi:hypothetical protein